MFGTEEWLQWKTIERCQICFLPCSLHSFDYPFRKCTTGNAGSGLVLQSEYKFLNQCSEFIVCEQATAWMHWCNVCITSKGIQCVENNSMLVDNHRRKRKYLELDQFVKNTHFALWRTLLTVYLISLCMALLFPVFNTLIQPFFSTD